MSHTVYMDLTNRIQSCDHQCLTIADIPQGDNKQVVKQIYTLTKTQLVLLLMPDDTQVALFTMVHCLCQNYTLVDFH